MTSLWATAAPWLHAAANPRFVDEGAADAGVGEAGERHAAGLVVRAGGEGERREAGGHQVVPADVPRRAGERLGDDVAEQREVRAHELLLTAEAGPVVGAGSGGGGRALSGGGALGGGERGRHA